jgi:hypothetical protein
MLSLVVLALGLAASTWFATKVVRTRPNESVEDAFVRITRKVVSAMGATIVTLLVMVAWIADQNDELQVTADQVAANAKANCENQRQNQLSYETALIADVRIARSQYTAAVEALQQADENLAAATPDLSQFGPEIQAAVEDSRRRMEHERERASAFVDALANEVAIREETLDTARTNQIEECPLIPVDG